MAILDTIAEIRVFYPVDKQLSLERLQPFIDSVIKNRIYPLTTETVFDDAVAQKAAVPVPPVWEPLIGALQKCVVWHTLKDAYNSSRFVIGENGPLAVESTGDRSTEQRSLYKYEKADFLSEIWRTAYTAEEELLAVLETPSAPWFADWENSDAATIQKTRLVRSRADAQKGIPILRSRKAFLDFLPYFEEAETEYVAAMVGTEYLENVLARQEAGTLTPEDEALLPLLRKYAAITGFDQARGFLDFTIWDGTAVLRDSKSKLRELSAEEIARLQLQTEKRKGRQEAKISYFLNENIADYPEIENWDGWQTSEEYEADKDRFLSGKSVFGIL